VNIKKRVLVVDDERRVGPKELPIPCFQCGVCCTRYQVRLSLVEARQIAYELGFDWDDWLDRYVDKRWPGTDTFLLRRCNGACIFLEHTEESKKSNCLIHRFKPSVCRIWTPSLYCKECREGLAKFWQLAVSPLGRLQGPEEKLRDFNSFIESLMIA
jgi:Fe-S-cluster containining protein